MLRKLFDDFQLAYFWPMFLSTESSKPSGSSSLLIKLDDHFFKGNSRKKYYCNKLIVNRPENIECPCPSQMSFCYLKSLMFHQSVPIVVTLKVAIFLMLTIIQPDSVGPLYRVSHPKNNHFYSVQLF